MSERRGSKVASASAAGGDDRLGALPDGVLEHVLSFLPSQDAVCTCVLARCWPRLWASTPSLRVTDGDSFEECHRFMSHLLLLRGRAPIDTCVLRFDGFSELDMPYIDLWIQYAVVLCRARELAFITDWDNDERLAPKNSCLITNRLTKLRLQGVALEEREQISRGARC